MKNNWSVKKIDKIAKFVVGVIIVFSAVAFFIRDQYWLAFLSVGLLIVLLKLDNLKKLGFNSKSGFGAEFQIPEENIKRDIEENNELITRETFANFKKVEEKVLNDIRMKLGGEMKRQIHFIYGMPDRPEFTYTPDAVIQTKTELIFLEIKYILKPELTEKIVVNTTQYLKTVLEKFSPSAGKKLVIKLILTSSYNIDYKRFKSPKGIELEFYKL